MSSAILAILPGDVGYNVSYMAVIFGAAVAITIVGFLALLWSTRHPDAVEKHSLAKYEPHWVVIILIIFTLFSVTTLPYLPYPYAHSNVKADMTVNVQAQQFAWCLSAPPYWGTNCQSSFRIPVGNTVLFLVRSIDVTHGFGMYQWTNGTNSYGQIVFQVQVMPGYQNSVEYKFTVPGLYYIRCLEFCGYGHYAMTSTINVTASF